MMRENDLTLSREDLYELVWSKPMVELAKDLGMSDVALAKRCRKAGVPVPGRGYWARVAAGQEPYRPKLRKREPEQQYSSTLSFRPVPEDAHAPDPADLPPEQAAVRARIDALALDALPGLATACPPIQRLARQHRVIAAGAIAWAHRTDRQGPVPQLAVGDALMTRALLILDTVLRAAGTLGWPFEAVKSKEPPYRSRDVEPPNPIPPGAIAVAGEPIAIRIDEPNKRIAHVLTADAKRRQQRGEHPYLTPWDYIASGSLCLQIHEPDSRYGGRSWRDGKRRKLEDQIRAILHALYDLALKIKARRIEQEERKRAWQERERLERERSIRRDAELKLIHELERQAGAWFRARLLHRYIRAARRALGKQYIEARRGEDTIDFFAWAEGYVDQLDPLHSAPRNADLQAEDHSWHAEIDLQKSFARFAGFKGQQSWKVLAIPDERAENGGDEYSP